ncbi:MAG: hypothetical protein JWQ28_3347 [Pedobacter sp.]|jgi:hypothetical protein|nr:hypothetical protein [Pedobacter sp.]
MKKFFLPLLCVMLGASLTASAQIQRGNVMMGGNIGNINLGLDDPKIFSVNIIPKAAWFVQDNIALGGYLDLGLETAKGSNTQTRYGVGALGRYYTGTDLALNHGRLFAEATFGFGGVNVSNGGGNTNGVNFSIGPGYTYFVTPSIGLEALLKYNGLTGFGNEGVQNSLNLTFGFQIYLPGRGTAAKVMGDVK